MRLRSFGAIFAVAPHKQHFESVGLWSFPVRFLCVRDVFSWLASFYFLAPVMLSLASCLSTVLDEIQFSVLSHRHFGLPTMVFFNRIPHAFGNLDGSFYALNSSSTLKP